MSDDRVVAFDHDNPEWTDADFAKAKPLSAFPALEAALKGKGGRPRGCSKEQVALRVDKDVLERFRSGGAGWQTRMNAALRAAVGL